MIDLSEFIVRASSRHPMDNSGYDSTLHEYRPQFLKPQSYQLFFNACPNLAGTPISSLPKIKSYSWNVKLKNSGPGGFNKTVSKNVTGGLTTGDCANRMLVPGEGNYLVTLTVKLQDGTSLTKTKLFPLFDWLVVSIGDSMASGQGNPDKNGDTSIIGNIQCEATTASLAAYSKFGLNIGTNTKPIWQDPRAYRSYKSGHSMAANRLQALSQGRVITFLSFASSGASIEQGLLKPQFSSQSIGQIEEARKAIGNRSLNALLITIGINDIGVIGTLKNLVLGFFGGKDPDQTLQAAKDIIPKIDKNFDLLAQNIQNNLKPRQVYITQYPADLFDSKRGGKGCGVFNVDTFEGIFLSISKRDAEVMQMIGSQLLNDAILRAAQRHGWFLVDGIEKGFEGHGYCASDTFFRGAEESCDMQCDFEGVIHPNEKGHAEIAKHIISALTAHTFTLAETTFKSSMVDAMNQKIGGKVPLDPSSGTKVAPTTATSGGANLVAVVANVAPAGEDSNQTITKLKDGGEVRG